MVFSDCWNAIVTELHEMDLISKKEKRNLMFILLQIDDTIQVDSVDLKRKACTAGFQARDWVFYRGDIGRFFSAGRLDSHSAKITVSVPLCASVDDLRPFLLPIHQAGMVYGI